MNDGPWTMNYEYGLPSLFRSLFIVAFYNKWIVTICLSSTLHEGAGFIRILSRTVPRFFPWDIFSFGCGYAALQSLSLRLKLILHSCSDDDPLPYGIGSMILYHILGHRLVTDSQKNRKKMNRSNFDELVKSPNWPIIVIPVKTGIQWIQIVLDSGLRRSDGFLSFYKTINFENDLNPKITLMVTARIRRIFLDKRFR